MTRPDNPHELVVVVQPPPDCDFRGVWTVIGETPRTDGDSHVQLRQGNSYIGTRRSNVRAATSDDLAASRALRKSREAARR